MRQREEGGLGRDGAADSGHRSGGGPPPGEGVPLAQLWVAWPVPRVACLLLGPGYLGLQVSLWPVPSPGCGSRRYS